LGTAQTAAPIGPGQTAQVAGLASPAQTAPAQAQAAPSSLDYNPMTDPRLATDPMAAPDPRLMADAAMATVPDGLSAGPPQPVAQGPAGRPLAIEAPRPSGLSGQPGQRRPGENTRAVHLPPPPVVAQQPLEPPIYRTSTFAFTTSAEYAAVLGDTAPGFSYSRIDNPTVTAFCTAVAALEGPNLQYQATSQAFASGMAAVSTIFLAFTRAGAHVVASNAVYGGTYSFLRNVASNFGVHTDFVDVTDLNQVHAALRQGTSILYVETLANPTVAVADLDALARLAHSAGALLVVDSTLAPPVICRPLEHGADLVLHSATKYFGGHSDVTGGVVTGHPELVGQLRKLRIDLGGSLAPDDAYTFRRGLETLPLRVRRQCSTAQVVAASLARHPAVSTVYYPGLTVHAGHELARRQFDAGPEGTRFGAVVTVAPYGGAEAGMAFADRLRLAKIAASLGGTHTKVSHVASTTHRQLDQLALKAAGIDPGSVRFSIGLEDAEDLLADAMAALDSLGRRS
jgi:cystathionine beta-lyase/cystathionine gamma-synthase